MFLHKDCLYDYNFIVSILNTVFADYVSKSKNQPPDKIQLEFKPIHFIMFTICLQYTVTPAYTWMNSWYEEDFECIMKSCRHNFDTSCISEIVETFEGPYDVNFLISVDSSCDACSSCFGWVVLVKWSYYENNFHRFIVIFESKKGYQIWVTWQPLRKYDSMEGADDRYE